MYRALLRTICSTLSDGISETPDLILLPIFEEQGQQGRPRRGNFKVPDSMLPEDGEPNYLAPNETFLDGAEELFMRASPDFVFCVPPWIRDMDLPINWRRDRPRGGLIEAFAEQTFHPPRTPEKEQMEFDDTPNPCRTKVPRALILFVPRQLVDMRRTGEWRRLFFSAHATTVIEHHYSLDIPGLDFEFEHSFSAVTLIIQPEPGPMRFFKINENALDAGSQHVCLDLAKLLKKQGGETQYGYVYRDDLTPDYPTTYDFYSPATNALRAGINDLSSKVSLAEVADILMGFSPIPMRGEEQEQGQRFRYISARNISRNGEFDFTEIRSMRTGRLPRVRMLENGDICVRRMPNRNGPEFICAEFGGNTEPIAFDHSVIVIRPKPFIEAEQRLVILAFLRSSVARDLFIAKGNSLMITPSVLHEFPVPLADKDLIAAIKDLTSARDAFVEWTARLDNELSDIISTRNMAESRLNLLNAGQLARHRYRAAQQVDSLDYRIRTQYPLPLAYLWRDWQVSSPDPYRSLRNILKAAEGLACFFALCALLAGRIANIKIGYADTIATRLGERGGGTNFGDWFAVLEEVGKSRKFREMERSVSFFEVTELMRSKSFEEALRLLMVARNDDSHNRIALSAVPTALLTNLETALTTIYTETAFVADYRLVQIKDSKVDSIRRKTNYEFADLTGDNPLVQIYKEQTDQTELEDDSLYLRDRIGQLHLFRPFLHYLECPECHLMSTFYLDKYAGAGSLVGLKSFERNSVREENFAEDFKWAGLLKQT